MSKGQGMSHGERYLLLVAWSERQCGIHANHLSLRDREGESESAERKREC